MCVSPDFFNFFSRFRGVVTFSSKGVLDMGNSMVVSDCYNSLTFGSSKRRKIGIPKEPVFLLDLIRHIEIGLLLLAYGIIIEAH